MKKILDMMKRSVPAIWAMNSAFNLEQYKYTNNKDSLYLGLMFLIVSILYIVADSEG